MNAILNELRGFRSDVEARFNAQNVANALLQKDLQRIPETIELAVLKGTNSVMDEVRKEVGLVRNDIKELPTKPEVKDFVNNWINEFRKEVKNDYWQGSRRKISLLSVFLSVCVFVAGMLVQGHFGRSDRAIAADTRSSTPPTATSGSLAP